MTEEQMNSYDHDVTTGRDRKDIFARRDLQHFLSRISFAMNLFSGTSITSIRMKLSSLHDCLTLLFGPFDMTYLYLQWESRFSEARVLFLSELMRHTFSVFM